MIQFYFSDGYAVRNIVWCAPLGITNQHKTQNTHLYTLIIKCIMQLLYTVSLYHLHLHARARPSWTPGNTPVLYLNLIYTQLEPPSLAQVHSALCDLTGVMRAHTHTHVPRSWPCLPFTARERTRGANRHYLYRDGGPTNLSCVCVCACVNEHYNKKYSLHCSFNSSL